MSDTKDKKKSKDKKKELSEEEAPVEAEEPVKSKKSKKKKNEEPEPEATVDEPEPEPVEEPKKDKKSKKNKEEKEEEPVPVEEPKPSKKDKKKDANKEDDVEEPKKKSKTEDAPADVPDATKKSDKKEEKKSKTKPAAEEDEVKEKVAASKVREAPAAAKKPQKKPQPEESESEEEDDGPDTRKKLLFIGASGNCGQVLLNHTLRDQTKYAAFPMVRNQNQLTTQQTRLAADVIVGDCTKAADVDAAVDGVDAVLVTLGHRKDSPADLIRSTLKNVLDAMKKHKVYRLVVLATAHINDFGDKNTISRKLLKGVTGTFEKSHIADYEAASELLETEGATIDWIMVRPPRIVSDPIEAKGKYKQGKLDLGPTDKISRADLADFMLKCVFEDKYIRQRPMVSY